MKDIGSWLEDIGLGEHDSLFKDNHIDFEILTELSEEDFKELGLSLGHRKKILKAIQKLDNPGLPDQPGIQQARLNRANDTSQAEKRFLTVLFCDLADSTRLTAALDNEDMHDLNRAYQSTCTDAILRNQGYVARYMGDGVLAYFGYPETNEDDAERAVVAGLDIVREIDSLADQFSLPNDLEVSVRIGIATGSVVVETIGEGTASENAIVGEAPNLAARLQGLAGENSIMIGPATHKLVESGFDFEDNGLQNIKGYDDRIATWKVLGPSSIDRRLSQQGKQHLTSLIGRDKEIVQLKTLWRHACEAEGQFVLLSGEAGLGKTRLIDTLMESVSEDALVIRLYCSLGKRQSALYPFIYFFLKEAGATPGDSSELLCSKLEDLLVNQYGYDGLLVDTVLLLSALKSPEAFKVKTDPQHQLKLLQEKIVDDFLQKTANQPVMVVVEDIHWIDATTEKTIQLLSSKIGSSQCMVLTSSRIENQIASTQSYTTSLPLEALSEEQSAKLIDEITCRANINSETLNEINRKGAGIPLFLEEVSKYIVNADAPHTTSSEIATIPDTLQASFMSTLDKLGNAKQLAQTGSVIGNTFQKSLLSFIAGTSGDSLDSEVQSLVNNKITVQESEGKDYVLRFRHALLRDAAYESILRKNRNAIHKSIADYLSNNRNHSNHATIAYHYQQANAFDSAFQNWLVAGESALNSGATQEAAELLENAFALLSEVTDSIPRESVYRLHLGRGKALNAIFGAKSTDAHQSFRDAITVADDLKDIENQVDARDYLFGITFNAGNIRSSINPASEMLKIGQDEDNLIGIISGHQGLGMANCTLGEFPEASRHFEAALTLSNNVVEGINCYPSMTLDYFSYVKFFTGDLQGARQLCQSSIVSARNESEYATVVSLSNSCFTAMMLTNYSDVIKFSDEAITLSRERGQRMLESRSMIFNDIAKVWLSEEYELLSHVSKNIQFLYESMEYVDLTYLLGMSAELQIKAGYFDEADSSLELALDISKQNEEYFYRPELLRLKAELIHSVEGESALDLTVRFVGQGLDLAKTQGATSWVAKIEEWRKHLPIYG